MKKGPLSESHEALGATMVDFAGWWMPLHYGSQIEEHHRVRQDVGMFDVSHMGIIDIKGKDAKAFLSYLLSNDIEKLKEPGSAFYTCLLNHQGGILDDLIVYYIAVNHYRLVVNAATLKKDYEWIQSIQSDPLVNANQISIEKIPLAILAIQGPHARKKVSDLFPSLKNQILSLKPFHFFITTMNDNINISSEPWMIARTGYTGEDGIEIFLPQNDVVVLWQTLFKAGISPIGLGARDTLRLEAGYNLYGQDMDESVTPFESNLAFTVAFEAKRDFIGRAVLEKQKQQGSSQKLVGILLLDKGVLRGGQMLYETKENDEHLNSSPNSNPQRTIGIVTSGSFSPTLKKAIGLARVYDYDNLDKTCHVLIRQKELKAQIVKPPFYRYQELK